MNKHKTKVWRKGEEFKVEVSYEIFPDIILISKIDACHGFYEFMEYPRTKEVKGFFGSLKTVYPDYWDFIGAESKAKTACLMKHFIFCESIEEDPIHYTEIDRFKEEIRSQWK